MTLWQQEISTDCGSKSDPLSAVECVTVNWQGNTKEYNTLPLTKSF